jgi:D-alanyl-lipoteichoic acid acyltransferase DltB (MBOAT superfamily)
MENLHMLFNSFEFIFVFLPIVLIIYFFLNKIQLILAAKIWLVAGSLFFYSWWNKAYLPLLLTSLFINFFLGSVLGKENSKVSKKAVLVVGIIFNVVFLGYYKYSDFFLTNVNSIFDTDYALLKLALPLAISFFTFEQIIYLVDSYRGETKDYSLLDYSLFVTFFPKLIAGPIVYHNEIIPQFKSNKKNYVNWKNISMGIYLFSIGLFKKVAIADTFSSWATQGFDQSTILTFFEGWVTSLSYTLQLYFDFSGYCDMAIGIALLFNIKLLINFNSPYKSLDIQGFWRRWHITLGRFLTHYIYIPLGGNRKGITRTYINVMVIFLISGFWHGAGWTFIFWGFLHGLAMCINRFWSTLGFKLNKMLAWFITFNFVNFAWVFFRAKSFGDAVKVLKAMCGLNGFALPSGIIPSAILTRIQFLSKYGVDFLTQNNMSYGRDTIIYILFGLIINLTFRNSIQLTERFKPTFINAGVVSIILLFGFIYMYALQNQSPFLYFNF